MKITKVETILHAKYPLLSWVRVHTDTGLFGTGETLQQGSEAIPAVVHHRLAPLLLGEDPSRIELLWQRMFKSVHYHGYAGAEMRAISAVDIALWDLFGKATNLPIYALLGGACRERIPFYNTCGSWGAYEDHERMYDDPAGLAKDLYASGVHAMKIWPFDDIAAEGNGELITSDQVARGVKVFSDIRDAVGDKMEIALDGHCLWSLPNSIRIAKALRPFRLMWIEELFIPDTPSATRELREAAQCPIVTSERLFTRWAFNQVMEAGAADLIMLDINWTGGFSEARKIATLASLHQTTCSPHNPGGPLSHAVAAHFCASTVNLHIMESVRAYYLTWHKDIVDKVLLPKDGFFPLPSGPGLGCELREDFLKSKDATIQASLNARHNEQYATGNPYRVDNPWRVSDPSYKPQRKAAAAKS